MSNIEPMSKASPRPWKELSNSSFIVDANGFVVFGRDYLGKKNEELVVRAVNAHDDLLTACKNALEQLLLEALDGDLPQMEEARKQLRAAIAKGTG